MYVNIPRLYHQFIYKFYIFLYYTSVSGFIKWVYFAVLFFPSLVSWLLISFNFIPNLVLYSCASFNDRDMLSAALCVALSLYEHQSALTST